MITTNHSSRELEQRSGDVSIGRSLKMLTAPIEQIALATRNKLPDTIRYGKSMSPITETVWIEFGEMNIQCLVATRERYRKHQIDIAPDKGSISRPFDHAFLEYDEGGTLSQFSVEHVAEAKNWLLKTDFTFREGVISQVKQTVKDNTYYDNPQKGPFWIAYQRLEHLERQGRLEAEEVERLQTMRRLVSELRQKFILTINGSDGKFKVLIGILLSNKDLVVNTTLSEKFDMNPLLGFESIARIALFQPAILK
jgi:hypothetical protein